MRLDARATLYSKHSRTDRLALQRQKQKRPEGMNPAGRAAIMPIGCMYRGRVHHIPEFFLSIET
jgi:hypothetical protein